MIENKEKKGSELIDILKQVSIKVKKTGVINSENKNANISSKVFVKNGHIVYATSTMYRSRFGDLMIKKGIITPKELNSALNSQKENLKKTLIGSILVNMGVISERVIPNLLYHQIEVVIYEILSWKNAEISFEECNIDDHPDYKRPISSNQGKTVYSDLNKLIDSNAFIKILENTLEPILNIRQYLSDPDAVPKRIVKSYPNQLTFDQRKILRAIDGVNSLNDIIVLSDLDYFRTYQIIFDLASEKVISVSMINSVNEEKTNQDLNISNEDNDNSNSSLDIGISQPEEKISTQESDEPKTQKTLTNNINQENISSNQDDIILKYQQQLKSLQEEIKQLKYKVNDYENSKVVLSEEITLRVSRLPYHKKVILNNILKNIMDIIEP